MISGAAEENSPAISRSSAGSRSTGQTETDLARAADADAELGQQPLGVVAGRVRLDHGGRAARSRRARRAGSPTSPARSRPAARTRSAAARRRRFAPARGRRSSSTSAPMRRSGSAIRSCGRIVSDSSPTSSNVPRWPASRPQVSRSTVPALPQSIGAAGATSPRRPTPLHPEVVVAVVRHLDAAGADDVDRRQRVGGAPEPADAALAVGDRRRAAPRAARCL